MINLIPPSARRAVTQEYWMRVSVVGMLLVSTVLMVMIALCIPAYLLLTSQLAAYQSQLDSAQVVEDDYKKLQQSIKDANQLAAHLSTFTNVDSLTDLTRILDEIAGVGVDLQYFELARTTSLEPVQTISISGVADSRGDLAALSENIAAHPRFKEAVIPIEALAKDRDISFSLEVIVAPIQ